MKKQLLTLVAIMLVSATGFAQSPNAVNKLSVGADFAVPTGDLSLISSIVYGGSVQGEFSVAKSLNLTASAGYLTFDYKNSLKNLFDQAGLKMEKMGAIPVKAGAKYYFGKIFYGSAELGASFSTGETSATAFAYASSLGINLPLAHKNALDLGVRYETWSNEGTSSFIGIRAAFAFGL